MLWWDDVPEPVLAATQRPQDGESSNIHPDDYAGPEACKKCHADKYNSWSKHPHRWMNAAVPHDNIRGDFSGNASISYLGGTATFYRKGDELRMRLVREDVFEHVVTQTIGSRFFQYYIGRQVPDPEKETPSSDGKDHVLPFGYWLDRNEWVPVVHVDDEFPDGERAYPFDPLKRSGEYVVYSESCDVCHTTFQLADILCTNSKILSKAVPRSIHFALNDYLDDRYSDIKSRFNTAATSEYEFTDHEMAATLTALNARTAGEHGVTLGISCEACHLGSKEHAEHPEVRPKFFPVSPHLSNVSDGTNESIDYGRNHTNVNWACGRCHVGERPYYANGASTWNSTEYSDAMRGSCYSALRCVDCHDPHQATGPKWKRSADEDDALCIRCHESFQEPTARQKHTHHSTGSAGARCMNCHMPHLNEGLQEVVRTHMISSPTNEFMIYGNQPNACNLCHVEESIDWTLEHLESWYEKKYYAELIDRAYPERQSALGLTWLKSDNEAIRLVAGAALARNDAKWAIDGLLDALDDPFLVNRQFGRVNLETMLGVRLEDFGYRFYMTPAERQPPLQKLRAKFGTGEIPVKAGIRN